jgi:hypothetical protein
MAKKNRVEWRDGDNIFVVRYGTTTNDKIAGPKQKIVQTYTFSVDQYEYIKRCVAANTKPVLKDFFLLDKANCLDCPLSYNSGNGKCYTHKYMQYAGFVSMLKSIAKDGDPRPLFADRRADILKLCEKAEFLRFGTYGEPSLIDIGLITDMVYSLPAGTKWTGYTHQSRKPWAQSYKAFFMASAHSDKDADSITGWRSFICVEDSDVSTAVQCPASKKLSLTTCSLCGLCAGLLGRSIKNVQIQNHY